MREPLPMSLSGGPVMTVAEAAGRMHEIATVLPVGDGVGCFAQMYSEVTDAVGNAIETGFFAASDFLNDLDVTFANIFFAAVDASATGGRVSRSWEALFARRSATDVSPLRFALAGMNAHINHDLAVALVMTLQGHGLDLTAAVHADYLRVNLLLDQLEPAIRVEILKMGTAAHQPDDDLADFCISAARNAAWDDAGALWRVRHSAVETEAVQMCLDDVVAAGSMALLLGDPLHRVLKWAEKRL